MGTPLKIWEVEILCFQDRVRRSPRNNIARYRVEATTAAVAIKRSVATWIKDTGKRIGPKTIMQFRARSL